MSAFQVLVINEIFLIDCETYYYNIMQYQKIYVTVILRVNTKGQSIPIEIEWDDGQTYKINRILGVKMHPPLNVSGILTRRFRIIVSGKERYLYCETETNKWFVKKLVLS